MFTVDELTLGIGIISFVVFIFNHLITIRWVAPEQLLRSLLMCIITTLSFPAVLVAVAFIFKVVHVSLMGWFCALVLAMLIEGLLCFFYVICIFGPYETSVRMRLVREIAKGGSQGISELELEARYNPETLVKIRLQRLIGSGDITEVNGMYKVISRRNIFFIFDTIGTLIKKLIGR